MMVLRRPARQLVPLNDDRTVPFSRPAARRGRRGERTRWLWLLPLAAGFATVLGWVLAHDPGRGLSDRGFITLTLAAGLVVLITMGRIDGRLLWTVVGCGASAALAVLLVTAAPGRSPADPATPPTAASAADAAAGSAWEAPRCVHMHGWTACVWHRAGDRSPTGQQGGRP